jgi:hypothetical protein
LISNFRKDPNFNITPGAESTVAAETFDFTGNGPPRWFESPTEVNPNPTNVHGLSKFDQHDPTKVKQFCADRGMRLATYYEICAPKPDDSPT